jgi:hypothetical protein
MGIKNRNIAANAKIDVSKLNLLDGDRVLWEDFDEKDDVAGDALYGFSTTLVATGTAKCDEASNLHLDCPANADKVLWFNDAAWTPDRNCIMGVRLVEVESIATVNFQIGWADSQAIAVAATDGPVMDAHDYGYVIFDHNESANFRLATNVGGVGPVRVDTGIGAAAGTVAHNITVQITPTGTVIAKIGGTTVRSTAAGTVKTGTSDWHPFVRIHANGAVSKSIKIDTFYASQSRTDA